MEVKQANLFDILVDDQDENVLDEIIRRRSSLFTISQELVYTTPNDAELGAKVRQIYNELKK
jgi:hypothetical protein